MGNLIPQLVMQRCERTLVVERRRVLIAQESLIQTAFDERPVVENLQRVENVTAKIVPAQFVVFGHALAARQREVLVER